MKKFSLMFSVLFFILITCSCANNINDFFLAAAVVTKSNTSVTSNTTEEQKKLFTVTLESYNPAKKIPVVRAIRLITGLELSEAMALVEGAPNIIKEGVSKTDADIIISEITTAGGIASIR